MGRVRLDGQTVLAKPLRPVADGGWIMVSLQHANRLSPGTEFMVTKDEIIDPIPDPALIHPETFAQDLRGLAELDAAMAKERETMTPVAELLKPIQDAAKPKREAEAAAAAGELVDNDIAHPWKGTK